MSKIAISYRRSDSAAIAGRIFDRLVGRYGKESVFMDIDSIPFGIDFQDHIRATLKVTDVLVVVIGANWTGRSLLGRSRIKQTGDPVRIEIETAGSLNVAMLPVLVGNAVMPGPRDLPDSLGWFSNRNAATVDPGRDFHPHVDRLIRAVDTILERKLEPNAVLPAPDHSGNVKVTNSQNRGLTYGVIGAICLALLLGAAAYWRELWPTKETVVATPAPVPTAPAVATAPPVTPASPPSAVPGAKGNDFCADLKSVLAMSGRMEVLRGERRGSDGWKTDWRIAGFSDCYLMTSGQPTFMCEMPATAAELATKDRLAKLAGVDACLGPSWASLGASEFGTTRRNLETGQLVTVGAFNAVENRRMVYLSVRQGPTSGPQPRPAGQAPKIVDLPKNFCGDLKRVITESKSQFEKILGRQNGTRWSTRVPFADFDECEINNSGTYRYQLCRVSPYTNADDASDGLDVLGAYISSCLGNGWSRSKRIDSNQLPRLSFEAGPRDASVGVRTYQSGVNDRWQLIVDVNAPEKP